MCLPLRFELLPLLASLGEIMFATFLVFSFVEYVPTHNLRDKI